MPALIPERESSDRGTPVHGGVPKPMKWIVERLKERGAQKIKVWHFFLDFTRDGFSSNAFFSRSSVCHGHRSFLVVG